MKKLFTLAVVMFVVVALSFTGALACGGDKAADAGAKKACAVKKAASCDPSKCIKVDGDKLVCSKSGETVGTVQVVDGNAIYIVGDKKLNDLTTAAKVACAAQHAAEAKAAHCTFENGKLKKDDNGNIVCVKSGNVLAKARTRNGETTYKVDGKRYNDDEVVEAVNAAMCAKQCASKKASCKASKTASASACKSKKASTT